MNNKSINQKAHLFYALLKKIPIAMRITLLLLFVLTFQLQAEHIYSQDTKISLNLKHSTIEKVLQTIEEKSDYYFLYNSQLIDVDRKVSVRVRNATISAVLERLFKSENVDYEVKGTQIILSPKEMYSQIATVIETLQQQKKAITGTVVDAAGVPIIGANIIEAGTTNGTVTDVDGKFSLSVENNAIIHISYIGYLEQDINTSGKASFNITLVEDSKALDEVVVVGYTSKRQSELSSSVTVIKSDKLQAGETSNNLGTMLQGKVPGLQVSNNTAHPQRNPNLVIRGVGSIGAGYNPLYVVDGIIGGSYNPSDIENITVLKDAAATGLYGSRAANGVILITTKSGKSGKTIVNYNGSFGLQYNRRGNLDMMDSQELYDNRREAVANFYQDRFAANDPNFTGLTLEQYIDQTIPPSVLNTDTDWMSMLTRRGTVNKHNISVSGGNEKTTFYLSGNFYKDQGVLIHEEYQDYNLRANLHHKLSDKLALTFRFDGNTYAHPNDPYDDQSSVAVQYVTNMPWDPAYEEDGITPYNPYESGYWFANNKANYFYDREHYYDNTRGAEVNSDLKLEYKINDFISFSTSNRFGIGGSEWKQLLDNKHALANYENGRLSQTINYNYSYLTSNLLSFSKSINSNNFSGILGQEYSYTKRSNISSVGIDIPVGLSALNSTGQPKSVGGNESETGFMSFFGQLDYNFNNRYYLVGSVRTDASSRFGKNNKWATFYTLGYSWIINNENFLNDISWIDLLKLKMSYGTTGNANIADYLSLGTYSFSSNSTYDGNSGARPARLANPDLTWEKAYTTNVGLEFAFAGRGKIEIDFYNRINNNLLQNVPLSAATGFSAQQRNVGKVRNRGVDLNLTTTNIDREVKWITNINFNINKNKILALNNHEDIESGNFRLRENLTMKDYYMKEWAGVDPDTGDPLWVRWEDENGELIHGADKKDPSNIKTTNNYNQASNLFIKSAYPNLTGGISNDLSYKNFELSIYCNYVLGSTIFFGQRQHIDDDGQVLSKGQMNFIDGWTRWEKPGDVATHPRLVFGGNKNSSQPSSRYLEDGSYFKIQNITLSYQFPDILSGLKVYAGVDNLAVFTKFSGSDPDVNIESPVVGQSKWGESYGAPRRYTLGVNVSF